MKLGIIGVGRVGSQVLTDVQYLNLFNEIVLIDSDEKVATGEALDHLHSQGIGVTNHINIYAGVYKDLKDADVIVIAASTKTDTSIPDRTALAKANTVIIKEITTRISEVTTEALLVVISNPVDAMTYIASKYYPENKVIGTGTLLETSRFKTLIAAHYGIDPKSVEGFVIGEHGAHAVPVWSKVHIHGMSLEEYETLSGKHSIDKDAITASIDKVSFDVFHQKGWTNAAISRVAVLLIKSLVLDEHTIFPLSTAEEHLAFSLPVLVSKEGIEQRYHITLDGHESEQLEAAKTYIHSTIQKNI
ncbi:lactate/malate family dehydrogenase [Macrococcus sp. CCM 2573]